MKTIRVRWIIGLAAMATIGMLNQTACVGFAADQLQRTVNFCFLFDCQNGAFGGLLDPCPGVEVGEEGNTHNLFIDCSEDDAT
jgi:hypothetical protein